jgi:hypothetical protein
VEDISSSELLGPDFATTSYILLPFHLRTNHNQPLAVIATRTVVPEVLDELDLRVEGDADMDLRGIKENGPELSELKATPLRDFSVS